MSNSRKQVKLQIEKGRLYPMGLHKVQNGLSIVSDLIGKNESGIVIYPEKAPEIRIPFQEEYRIGDLYCLYIPEFPFSEFSYSYYQDGKPVADPYAKLVNSAKRFGNPGRRGELPQSVYREDTYDWEGDSPLEIPFHESILYKLHVRGFTKHISSEVQARGTFAGLTEKISYLKELGITAIECMPIHEFGDVIYNPAYSEVDETLLPYMDENQKTWKYKVNYWGYSAGSYMAPKRAYAFSDRADIECKDMIKALHQNGIEVILEFYFPADIRPGYILDVCRYWTECYHVDGFKLMGCGLPIKLLATDPYLKKTKLIFESFGGEDLQLLMAEKPEFKNLAVISQGFMYDARKFLKGDEDMLSPMAGYFRNNPPAYGILNEITSYQGFTLADLVSYDRKHNEDNGEDNRDGNDYNYSWNCGVEGKSRRKPILTLREQQSKNALMMLFLAQGTPVLLAGDEFGNSADGNNNPYCQDNEVSWLNWKMTVGKGRLQDFVKTLIAFRRQHPILHMQEQLRQMDYASCGYPDLSYHGEQAWYPQFENYNRHMGIMYCGKYAKIDRTQRDAFIYVAYNEHWIEHEFALPNLPEKMHWEIALSSGKLLSVEKHADSEKDTIAVSPRTIVVLAAKAL
jgi:glycogen operon protein